MRWLWPVFSFIFCFGVFFYLWSSHHSDDSHTALSSIESNLQDQLQYQQIDIEDFSDQFTIYSNPFDISSDESFHKRVYVNGSLVYWSDDEYIGDYTAFRKKDSTSVFRHQASLYIINRQVIPNRSALVEIYSFLPLIVNPPFSNQYLQRSVNPEVFAGYDVRLVDGALVTICGLQLPLFVFNQSSYPYDLIILLMFTIAAALLIWKSFHWLYKRYSDYSLVISFGAVLLIVRVLLWTLTTYVIKVELFDPIHYTSTIGRSIGDVLLHSLFGLIFIVLLVRSQLQIGLLKGTIWSVLLAFSCWNLSLMGLSELVWNLLDNSLFSFDISKDIQFDFLRSIFFLVIILFGAILFFLFVLCHHACSTFKSNRWWLILLYIPIASIAACCLRESGVWAVVIGGLVFLMLGLSRTVFSIYHFDYRTFLYLSIVLAATSAIYAIVIYHHYAKDELISKKRFANRLLIKNDFLGEYYLSQKVSKIERDAYIRTRLSNHLLAKKNVKEKIKRQYLSSYFDKYDVEVLLFDAEGASMDGLDLDYQQIRKTYGNTNYATDYEAIFFVEDKEEYIQDRYYCFIPVSSFDHLVGYVVLRMVLKKYIPRSVFPQLMVENGYYFTDGDRYDYAAYRNGKLLYKQGRFEFQNKLDYPDLVDPKLFEKGLEREGTHFFGMETSEGTVFVIASSTYSKPAIVSNFSFLYLVLLFSFGIGFIVIRFVGSGIGFNLSTKIQLYLGLSFLIPMLIVSIALLNTLNQTYKEEIDNSFSTKAYNISEYLTEVYERFLKNQINRDELANAVSEASSLIQSDINLYGSNGQLMISSEMELFNLGLLGRQIDPQAYNAIKYSNSESKIYKKRIGDLVFSVAYVGLRSYKDGRLLGMMSMPYFDSKNHLIRQQIEVFNDLISIFTIIFIASVIIGNMLIERLVRPLKMITERLKLTDLREVNEPLYYDSNDEIGALISEYNLMILKLEESKAALAESQKESAWKEIARQVAHEIKNPLTPMRLKIQQMMRQKEMESVEYRTLGSLIAQVDALSAIADSFSAFARMPAPKNERFDLLTTLKDVLTLHSTEGIDIKTPQMQDEPLWIYADHTIFSGIFNNVILNAIQSVEGRKPIIEVEIINKRKKVVLSFKDNGSGISEADRDRIFTPYFSTKITGSGIGLAVAKKGIENAGGNIWFESQKEVGTTFYISMPLVS